MEIVEVYRVQPILGFGIPLLITTMTSTDPKRWACELFLLFDDRDRTVVEFPFTVSTEGWPVGVVAVDEAFVRAELLQQARWRANNLLEQRGFFEKHGPLPSPLIFEGSEERALYVYSIQTASRAGLSAVRNKTNSVRLKSLLDIALSLPGASSHAG